MGLSSRSLLILGLLLPAPALGSWPDEVGLLITPREREAFQGLSTQEDREAFIQGFWLARDPFPETPINEARESWETRLQEARQRWGGTEDERARVFLLNGDPGSSFSLQCEGAPLEVWTYPPRFRTHERSILVFRQENGKARLWHPGDQPDLFKANLGECGLDPRLVQASLFIRVTGPTGYEVQIQQALTAPKPRDWIASFQRASAQSSRDLPTQPARLDVDFPGRRGDGWVRVRVAPEGLAKGTVPATGGGREVVLTGRILRGAQMIDSFRYRFESVSKLAAGLPLAFERRLRPGRYKLEVEVDAPAEGRVLVGERELAVPAAEPAPPPAPPQPAPVPAAVAVAASLPAPEPEPAPEVTPEVRRMFDEADSTLSAPRAGLRILVPPGNLLSGSQRFDVRVDGAADLPEGERIERVSFIFDGKPVLTRNRPPYVALLDLGQVPRPHQLAVEGFNAQGEVLARDEILLNGGAQRLAVRLVEPRPDRTYRRSLRLRAEVEGPEDQKVERVELYLGDARVATLYQPPYTQPLVLPGDAGIGYVRAVAYLADGTSAEDLVLLNSPVQPEKMDIRLVELYANVVDGSGRPVEGLGSGDLRVFEDGVKQSLRQVERVTETPLRLVTLIDNSASMKPRLEDARQAALQFLRRTLQPRDQAAVVTFNRVPKVTAPLTADLSVLEEGLSGLSALQSTSLYDSLIFSLYYLGGAPGQRAVLLLSDGQDRTSRFRYEDALESARRAGVAIYVIGIDLPRGEGVRGLSRLAEETGGRSFFLKDTAELGQAYEAIEKDLRSRYRVTYQSSNTQPGDAFRAVRLEVGKPGLEARTVSGYYP